MSDDRQKAYDDLQRAAGQRIQSLELALADAREQLAAVTAERDMHEQLRRSHAEEAALDIARLESERDALLKDKERLVNGIELIDSAATEMLHDSQNGDYTLPTLALLDLEAVLAAIDDAKGGQP